MKPKTKYPSISVVIATYNSERTIKLCLASIRRQIYPQEKIEIIMADGGSTDQTLTIAKLYGVKVIRVERDKQNAEYNKATGLARAGGEIVAMIDHDNVLPHGKWLAKMIVPFIKHPKVVGVESLRYHYDPKTSLLDRYFALFGAGDPLVWYLGKTDRLSYLFDKYSLAGLPIDYGTYYLVDFTVQNMPTIGANGFLVRRDLLMRYAQCSPGKYFDMDVNIDLIKNGFTTYAFVKDTILHLTGYGSIWYFLRRRMLFMTQYNLGSKGIQRQAVRRYGRLNSKEKLRLLWVILLSLTIVVPLKDSIRGWLKIHDSAWFLHPLLCFGFVVIYSWVIMKHQLEIICKTIFGQIKKYY